MWPQQLDEQLSATFSKIRPKLSLQNAVGKKVTAGEITQPQNYTFKLNLAVKILALFSFLPITFLLKCHLYRVCKGVQFVHLPAQWVSKCSLFFFPEHHPFCQRPGAVSMRASSSKKNFGSKPTVVLLISAVSFTQK